jgi:hypothetical protein
VVSQKVSRVVASGKASAGVNPGLKTPQFARPAALLKMAVIVRGYGTLQPPRGKTSLDSKSTGAIGYIKKQPETHQQHQARVATALLRTLDRKSAIVTVLLK